MKKNISDDLLSQVSGGESVLPENWEALARQLVPLYKKKYKNITFDQACDLVRQTFADPTDQELVIEFLRQYFDENGKLI